MTVPHQDKAFNFSSNSSALAGCTSESTAEPAPSLSFAAALDDPDKLSSVKLAADDAPAFKFDVSSISRQQRSVDVLSTFRRRSVDVPQ